MNKIPLSTQWLLDAAGESGRTAIKSVYMIVCLKTSSKGTGFLLEDGYIIITNEHVIRDCNASEVLAISSFKKKITFSNMSIDKQRDLAILTPSKKLEGGLVLSLDAELEVGTVVSTWGFPLGYNGPAPLLSVGYLAGFIDYIYNSKTLKHLVVNGAFNPGNSGGSIFKSNEDKVIGVVVSKHVPISKFHVSALNALAKNQSGVVFTSTDDKGNTTKFVESQIVADLLFYFRNLTQVMIGEAISVVELKEFLNENRTAIPHT
jgi:hypothetical protein